MFLDVLLRLSNSQAVTSAADSTNMIDQGVVGGRDLGSGQPLFLVVCVTQTMTDGGGNTYPVTVSLQGDSTDTMSPDVTQDVLSIPANTAAGNRFYVALAPGMLPLQKQFVNIKYTPVGGNLTAGKFTAYFTHEAPQPTKFYADNVTIS